MKTGETTAFVRDIPTKSTISKGKTDVTIMKIIDDESRDAFPTFEIAALCTSDKDRYFLVVCGSA